MTDISIPRPTLGSTSAGYAGGQYPKTRSMGQFDRLQVRSLQVAVEDQLITKRYFGLRHTDTFFDALLSSKDGQFYLISNSVQSTADAERVPDHIVLGAHAATGRTAPHVTAGL